MRAQGVFQEIVPSTQTQVFVAIGGNNHGARGVAVGWQTIFAIANDYVSVLPSRAVRLERSQWTLERTLLHPTRLS